MELLPFLFCGLGGFCGEFPGLESIRLVRLGECPGLGGGLDGRFFSLFGYRGHFRGVSDALGGMGLDLFHGLQSTLPGGIGFLCPCPGFPGKDLCSCGRSPGLLGVQSCLVRSFIGLS